MLRVAKKTKECSLIVQDEIVIICLLHPEEPFDNKLEPVNYLLRVYYVKGQNRATYTY